MSHAAPISVAKERPDPRVLALVPENVARRLSILPLRFSAEGELLVAAADPCDALAFDELRVLTGSEVRVFIDSAAEIGAAISRHYKIAASVHEAMSDFNLPPDAPDGFSGGRIGLTAGAPPVVRLFDEIMAMAVRERASDVHVEPREESTVIRLRVDGRLFESLSIANALHAALTARIKITCGMDIAERRKPQDGRALLNHGGRKIDVRASSLPSVLGEKMVLRLLDQRREDIGIEKLGFDVAQIELLRTAAQMVSGMFLIAGPTGSGKSTTLYSLLELMNSPEVNTISIEDPVEYTIKGITQIQVNEKSGVTFPVVLRSVLRQDPDRLMVGEIRDSETAELAVRAALTGHAVLSTVHTNSAASAVVRLADVGVPPYLLASSLRGMHSRTKAGAQTLWAVQRKDDAASAYCLGS